jgi:hypothetical protein
MSIKNRVDDALVLWNAGRKEGAWVLALVAAAATARKRYPRPMKDNESFKAFIRDITLTLVYGKPAGENRPAVLFGDSLLEDIIYKDMRCKFVHEAEIEGTVVLDECRLVNGGTTGTMRVGGGGKPHGFPDFWALHLLKAVREALENRELFSGPASGPRGERVGGEGGDSLG